MRNTARFLFAMVLLVASGTAPLAGQSSNHVEWVGQSIKAMQSIKVGMTRADLAKVFTTEGGMSTRINRTYVYRDCPYFKVDVEFEPDPASPDESSKDKIVAISKPYLAFPTND